MIEVNILDEAELVSTPDYTALMNDLGELMQYKLQWPHPFALARVWPSKIDIRARDVRLLTAYEHVVFAHLLANGISSEAALQHIHAGVFVARDASHDDIADWERRREVGNLAYRGWIGLASGAELYVILESLDADLDPAPEDGAYVAALYDLDRRVVRPFRSFRAGSPAWP